MSFPYDGVAQPGQQYDPKLNIPIPFTEQMDVSPDNVAALIGTAGIEVTPNDAGSADVRTYGGTAIDALFLAIVEQNAQYVSIDLPDTLISVTAVFAFTLGDGTNTQTGTGTQSGTSGSLSLSLHSSSQGSASVTADLSYVLKSNPKTGIPGNVLLFFVKGNATFTSILARLNTILSPSTVSMLPLFSPQIDTLTLSGGQISVSASADVSQRLELTSTTIARTEGTGTGQSLSSGASTSSRQLPKSLHAAITISPASAFESASADATASMDALGSYWNALSKTITAGPLLAVGAVSPDTISATTPADIPRTGLYLTDVQYSPFAGHGWTMVRATVVDFGQFA